MVVGVGVFFVGFRPPLLPEDRRYIAAPEGLLEAVPGLSRWLEKVFWVMGGFIVAVGILTIDLALSGVRDGTVTAWIVAGVAGVASVGLMAVVNVMLRSDFRRPLLGLALLWTAAVLLAAFGV
ncbi:MAG: hypothetical protein ACR2NB_01510 [Solirubrobacteraceae bacterium]